MLPLLVAALVPTMVMTAALSLERFERCVLRHVPLDGAARRPAAVTRLVGDGSAAAPVDSRTPYDP
jgi:hypothetical protein